MTARTKAILDVLQRANDEKVLRTVLRVFGASSIEECQATYAAVGAAERKAIDDVIERVLADANAVFLLRLDNELSQSSS